MMQLDPLRYVLSCCFGASRSGPISRLTRRAWRPALE
ncbi:hypothetical protein SAMN05421759_10248 [Roseivivax lentus]|uniref:Uncharacterized protein n=1 Tax=Roseivivax lentus TaxID=633194 RepID=A0A1N7KTD4_9RHOB|nr:hypothetical protein SAMN05421759_10248 [Roseivivax lentus]